jgi:cytoskeletal protein CcmA (bactofilin family)
MSFMKGRTRASTPVPPTGFSLIDAAMSLTGDIETSASLRIDGRIEGTIRRADVVVLGVGATMTGDIHAREVIIGGTLNGSVHAGERVELQATAVVTGDLVTQSVLIQEGGVANGRVLMRPPEPGVGGNAARAKQAPARSPEPVAAELPASPARR